MLTLFRRRREPSRPPSAPPDGRHMVLDDTLVNERQRVLDEFCAYERELFSRTPTLEELAEYERRKEQVREHGRECIRRECAEHGVPSPV